MFPGHTRECNVKDFICLIKHNGNDDSFFLMVKYDMPLRDFLI